MKAIRTSSCKGTTQGHSAIQALYRATVPYNHYAEPCRLYIQSHTAYRDYMGPYRHYTGKYRHYREPYRHYAEPCRHFIAIQVLYGAYRHHTG